MALMPAIRSAITSTGYESNEISIKFELEEDEVIVHPRHTLNLALQHVSD
jgi:hypothetical protein